MSPRTNQLERTHSAIVEAAAEFLFDESEPGEFTMQAVADRAGVSHRTLYRHFDDRQSLIDAVGRHLEDQIESPVEQPTDFDGWIASLEAVVGFGVTHREMLRRATMLGVSTGTWRSDRDHHYWLLFRERFPHLDEATARQDFAMLRHALGAANVVTVGERFGLSPEKLVPAMTRAVEALIEAIDARDEAAKGETT